MEKSKKSLNTQGRLMRILGYVLICASVLFTVLVLFGRFIPFIKALGVYHDFDILTDIKDASPGLRSVSYIICISTIAFILRKIIVLLFGNIKQGGAIVSLIASALKYVALLTIILLILSAFGVNTSTLIAGIGILSLIVGLAIQPLLQDIIAGIFVVFEKTYDVGDVIVVDGFRGTVTEIGIRTTKIKDAGGDIKVINNSDIRTLVNMTREMSYAVCDVDIEYSEALERVEKVIEDNLEYIKEKIPAISDGPYYKGVVSLGVNGVTIRLVAECPEGTKFQTQRDLNRQIKLLFDRNNISIPFAQVVVHTAPTSQHKSDKEGFEANDAFILLQNELSRDIGDEENN